MGIPMTLAVSDSSRITVSTCASRLASRSTCKRFVGFLGKGQERFARGRVLHDRGERRQDLIEPRFNHP